MDGTALVVCDGLLRRPQRKTAHGLVRGTERYRIVGVVDAPTAGRDAGEVLDGRRRGIPIFATHRATPSRRSGATPDFCVVGVATSGGRLTPGLRGAARSRRSSRGMSVVNGLHEFLSDDPELVAAAAARAASRSRTSARPRRGASCTSGAATSCGRRAAHRRARDRLRPRQAHDRALPAEACRDAGIRDRADLHGPDRLDAGRAVRLHPRLRCRTTSSRASSSTRSSPAGENDRQPELILLEGQSALAQPVRARAAPSSCSPAARRA